MARSAWQSVGRGIAAAALFLLVAELMLRITYAARARFVDAVPLPYTIGDDSGPAPPWVDGSRMLEPDARLIWRNRGDFRQSYIGLFVPFASDGARLQLLRRFSPRLPKSIRERPRWEVSLDSRGFREAEFSDHKTPDTFRILCLGDSWTFGANVAQDETYPRQLEHVLERRFPTVRFEVLNLGVLGYTSFQGRELLESSAIHWQPDFVIIGFGMNDGSVGFRDKDVVGPQPRLAVGRLVERSEVLKLLRYWALMVRYRPRPTGEAFRTQIGADAWVEEQRTAGSEPVVRVSLTDYGENLRAMIDLAQRSGAAVAVLDNEIEQGPYGEVMARAAAETSVPLIRSDRLIARERARAENDRSRRLGLRAPDESAPDGVSTTFTPPEPAPDGTVEVVFRVFAERASVPRTIYVVGDQPALGDLVPNRVALHDDGLQGDEKSRDGVWSYAASFRRGALIHYAYTNSGDEGAWNGLDVPAVRRFRVPATAEGPVYRAIESFGAIDLQSDSWHTDRDGLRLIAEAAADAVVGDPSLERFLDRRLAGATMIGGANSN